MSVLPQYWRRDLEQLSPDFSLHSILYSPSGSLHAVFLTSRLQALFRGQTGA